jgi:hypothetical protein
MSVACPPLSTELWMLIFAAIKDPHTRTNVACTSQHFADMIRLCSFPSCTPIMPLNVFAMKPPWLCCTPPSHLAVQSAPGRNGRRYVRSTAPGNLAQLVRWAAQLTSLEVDGMHEDIDWAPLVSRLHQIRCLVLHDVEHPHNFAYLEGLSVLGQLCLTGTTVATRANMRTVVQLPRKMPRLTRLSVAGSSCFGPIALAVLKEDGTGNLVSLNAGRPEASPGHISWHDVMSIVGASPILSEVNFNGYRFSDNPTSQADVAEYAAMAAGANLARLSLVGCRGHDWRMLERALECMLPTLEAIDVTSMQGGAAVVQLAAAAECREIVSMDTAQPGNERITLPAGARVFKLGNFTGPIAIDQPAGRLTAITLINCPGVTNTELKAIFSNAAGLTDVEVDAPCTTAVLKTLVTKHAGTLVSLGINTSSCRALPLAGLTKLRSLRLPNVRVESDTSLGAAVADMAQLKEMTVVFMSVPPQDNCKTLKAAGGCWRLRQLKIAVATSAGGWGVNWQGWEPFTLPITLTALDTGNVAVLHTDDELNELLGVWTGCNWGANAAVITAASRRQWRLDALLAEAEPDGYIDARDAVATINRLPLLVHVALDCIDDLDDTILAALPSRIQTLWMTGPGCTSTARGMGKFVERSAVRGKIMWGTTHIDAEQFVPQDA